jgi:hypothetical protein
MTDSDPNLVLLQKWAPIVNIHNSESYMPCNVEWYLQQCELLDANGNVSINPIPTSDGYAALVGSNNGDRNGWHVKINDVATTIKGQASTENGVTAACYGYVRILYKPGSTTDVLYQDLDYWLFFPYNGNTFSLTKVEAALGGATAVSSGTWLTLLGPLGAPLSIAQGLAGGGLMAYVGYRFSEGDGDGNSGFGLHQSDWVRATVRLDASGNFVGLNLEQHSDDVWIQPSDIQWTSTEAGRPIIYAAQSSHELYPKAGNVSRLAGMATDACEVSDAFHKWDLSTTVVDVGWDPDITDQPVLAGAGASPDTSFTYSESNAVSGDGTVIVVKQSSTSKTEFLIFGGDWSQGAEPPVYWNSGAAIATFSDSKAMMQQSVDPPAVALGDAGQLFIAYRHTDGSTYLMCGLIDKDAKKVNWWYNATPQRYNLPSGTASAPLSLSFARFNDVGVLVETHAFHNNYYYMAASVDYDNQQVIWWNPNNSKGQQNLFGGRKNGNGIAVAINNQGTFVVAHEPGDNVTQCHIGLLDATSKSLKLLPNKIVVGPGVLPTIALNENNMVVVIAAANNNVNTPIMYSGQVVTYQSSGTPQTTTTTISFGQAQNVPGLENYKFPKPLQSQVSLLADQNWFALIPISAGTPYPVIYCWGIVESNFAQWTPNNGANWLKYSGSWGKPGEDELLSLGNVTIYVLEQGPPGPAYRQVYIDGPSGQVPG